ncbi:MAG: glutaredoxin family protein [Chloroflexi bacterium]|nr:glutaredoxin family protein [Chloroflexota bacterium]
MNVIVYSHERCVACRVLKEFLADRGVRYTLRNLQTDPSARQEFLERGFLLPPVTVIDGEVVMGFDPFRLEELLDRGQVAGGPP